MKSDPDYHQRKNIRLKGYDYSQIGMYYITICCQDRICLFGEIASGKLISNDAGIMIEREWLKLPDQFPNIVLHEFVVMPNHFHGILQIDVGAPLVVAQNNEDNIQIGQPQGIAPTNKTVGDMVGAFKSISTVEYIRGVEHLNWQRFNGKLWHRNYHEHIIRDELSYRRISNYIRNNPANWENDRFYIHQ